MSQCLNRDREHSSSDCPPVPPPALPAQRLPATSAHRQILVIVGAAAVLGRDAHALGEQEVIIALTAFKAAGSAASEAGEGGTGALAGARADGVVAVGRTLESCGERKQGGSRVL